MKEQSPKLAFWFRYGLSEHTKLFSALPGILLELSRRCEVHYYGCRGPDDGDIAWAENIHLHILPVVVDRSSDSIKLLTTLLWIFLLPLIAIHCRLHRIRAIYIDETIPLACFWARLICGKKVATTIADLFLETYREKWPCLKSVFNLVQRIDERTWNTLPLIFTRSKAALPILHAQFGLPMEILVPVYDACDFSIFHPLEQDTASKEPGFGPETLTVCYHGVLHPNKGLGRIIRSMDPLLKSFQNLHFVIIGNGSEYERLTHLSEDLGLSRQIHFLGYLPPERVAEHIHASDIGLVCRVGWTTDNLVVTSVLGRYMACKVPVLASRVNGIAEIIEDGVSGLLFDPQEELEFRQKLELLIRQKDLRKKLAGNAYPMALKLFDKTVTIQKTVDALWRMLQQDESAAAPYRKDSGLQNRTSSQAEMYPSSFLKEPASRSK